MVYVIPPLNFTASALVIIRQFFTYFCSIAAKESIFTNYVGLVALRISNRFASSTCILLLLQVATFWAPWVVCLPAYIRGGAKMSQRQQLISLSGGYFYIKFCVLVCSINVSPIG